MAGAEMAGTDVAETAAPATDPMTGAAAIVGSAVAVGTSLGVGENSGVAVRAERSSATGGGSDTRLPGTRPTSHSAA